MKNTKKIIFPIIITITTAVTAIITGVVAAAIGMASLSNVMNAIENDNGYQE